MPEKSSKPGTRPPALRGDAAYRERAYALVMRIPPGKVMSYGLVAKVLGQGYDARAIGNIMFATPDDDRKIPWHRVMNSRGACSTAGLTMPPDLQQRLLENEGITFNASGRCAIEHHLWTPPEFDDDRESSGTMPISTSPGKPRSARLK